MRDLLYAWRLLRRAPLFAASAIATLGLGIGANTAIFTVVNAVLLRPIAAAEPERLVSVFVNDRQNPGHSPISTYNFRDLRDGNDVFSGMTAIGFGTCTLTQTGEEPRQAACQPVTANYFEVLGVTPVLGRGFQGDEDGPPGAHPVAVLSDGAWARLFGSDPGILGRSIVLNGRSLTIVGVTPPSFKGTATLFAPDLWFPLSMYDAVQPGTPWLESRRWRWLGGVGRLKSGVSLATAQAAVTAIARNLEREYPDINAGRTFELVPLSESLINPDERGGYVRAAWLLAIVVAIVLLIACANLANLLLARAAGRKKEIAIRLAIGADRGRVVRQMLTESLLLAALGGCAGLIVARWMQAVLWTLRPAFLAHPGFELAIDARALAFVGVVSTATGLMFGLVPALQASSTDIDRTLRQGGRDSSVGVRRALGGALVIAQVSFSVVALAAAGVFVHSLIRAQHIDLRFDAARLLTLGVNPTAAGYDPARQRLWIRQTLDRIAAIPGVRSVTIADRLPLSGGIGYNVTIDGKPRPPGGLGYAIQLATVGPHYFDTVGLPLTKGRDFAATDREGTTQVAIVNETMARRFWQGEDPIGKRFSPIINTGPIQIVGVAQDSRYLTLGEGPMPFFYLPLEQQPRQSLSLIVKSAGPPERIQAAVAAELRRADPQLLVANVAPMPELVGQALWAPRTAAMLLVSFAAVALALAAVGIYGVMAYSVSQRTRELGLRMALGASRSDLLQLVVGRGMALAGVGLALGVAVTLVCGRFVVSLLYGIDATDPLTLCTVVPVLAAVNFAACWVPATRAARLDAVVVLRGE